MAEDQILEEEVSYVMLEFGGILESEFENKMDKPCKILGLDTETPYMDIGGSVFKGEFEDAPDTYVFFEADGTRDQKVDGSGSYDNVRYTCHTSKKINLVHSLLSKKTEDAPQAQKKQISDFAMHAAEVGGDAIEVPDESINLPCSGSLKPGPS